MGQLESKVALVTGASRGIGKSIALKFASEGANVAFTYSRENNQIEEVVKELEGYGIKAKAYRSNAADFSECEQLIKDITNDFGSLEVIVNNAGITKDNLLMRMSEEDFDKVISVNLKSVFNTTKSALRGFLKSRKGSIINISSVVGVNGNPGQSNYSASKAGIHGFTKSMAKELGSRNIRVNAIAPGFIATEMTEVLGEDVIENWTKGIPLKRAGNPEDVANLCVFLASDNSSYITGQVINVCGGMST
ncbi:MAG: 3-oxoacyl-[acyl-carrier-protein] reductase [Flavobacteriales bacterium]|nr:3-oxoacyl-[acyl-carrier-protein] reductase [Flavobacteriales bacterium]|tara:strand:- start:6904 stop:7650 length:747 start_codon:yes stop_codon:yes gene_type:complete